MADDDRRAALIPQYVSPPMFDNMSPEFLMRRERNGVGKAQVLLDRYNESHGTQFKNEVNAA